MRRMLLAAAAGFVGGWVAAHIDRGLGAGVDVPTEFRYRPQPVRIDDVDAAMRRHPAGKRLAHVRPAPE